MCGGMITKEDILEDFSEEQLERLNDFFITSVLMLKPDELYSDMLHFILCYVQACGYVLDTYENKNDGTIYVIAYDTKCNKDIDPHLYVFDYNASTHTPLWLETFDYEKFLQVA